MHLTSALFEGLDWEPVHAGHELVLKARDATGELEGRHRLAKLVGLAAGKAGADHRHPHRRFLKQRHAERLAEHRLKLGRRIFDCLLAFAPPQIGMHHGPSGRE